MLRDHATIASSPISREAALAVGQAYPHVAAAEEMELAYGDPELLAKSAARRLAGQNNLGRLGALTLAPPGLFVAVSAAAAIGRRVPADPPDRAAGAALGRLPGLSVWGWPTSVPVEHVARDLAGLRAAAGDDTRAVLIAAPGARIASVPFAGELGPMLDGDVAVPLAAALALPPGAFEVDADVPWTSDAEALARLAGFSVSRRW